MGLTREELNRLLAEAPGPLVPPMLDAAYRLELHRDWSAGEKNPHGQPWHTSFHASEFPGEDPNACGRLAVYKLLDVPAAEPIKPFLKGWFDLGLNLEHDWVRRLSAYGTLLSLDVNQEGVNYQTGFRDDKHWLTGASDAIVLDPRERRAHCVEIKTTSHEKVMNMLNSAGQNVPKQHAKYKRQLGVYIALAHEAPFTPTVTVCKKSGLMLINEEPDGIYRCAASMRDGDKPHELLHDGFCELEKIVVKAPDSGTLIYSSREEPMTIASFNVPYDPKFMQAGRKRLADWQESFIEEHIPAHPHEKAKAKWSVEPCQYCDFKKDICKPDYTELVIDLAASHVVEYAQSIQPGWNYEEKRRAVLARWNLLREESPA